MFKQINCHLKFQARRYSTKVEKKIKPIIHLDGNINELIKKDELKPRKHEGRVYRPAIALPKWIIQAMKRAFEGNSKDTVIRDASDLHRHLIARLPPPENDLIESKCKKIGEDLKKRLENTEMKESEDESIPKNMHDNIVKELKKSIVPWAAIQYDTHRSLMYMIARGAQDYAILHKIIGEIQSRDPNFRPKTLLDFGSGIGTVSWVATEVWRDSLKERMCIDISTEINDLAETIMKNADQKIKSNAFHRQYLPVTPVPTYDIAVSAFSLMELPSRKMRFDTIASLWKKTDKYLVLVETGTKGGFQIISEARDFILHLINIQKARDPTKDGFVLAPCPHDLACPKLTDNDDFHNACKMEVKFFKVVFSKMLVPQTARYSYVVFKKGAQREEKDSWPRIVRPVLRGSGRAICRICTAGGKLQELIITKGKHERPLYYCARSSRWGDRLPITIDTPAKEKDAVESNEFQ